MLYDSTYMMQLVKFIETESPTAVDRGWWGGGAHDEAAMTQRRGEEERGDAPPTPTGSRAEYRLRPS